MRLARVSTPPAYGTIGNASRNIFRSPAYYNVDLSLAKDWKFKERYGLQFRAEFFNFLNRADYATPSGKPIDAVPAASTDSLAALVQRRTRAMQTWLGSGGPRHIQFGLKITY